MSRGRLPSAGFSITVRVQVPADALWRAQTQRAVENFPISGRGLERAQIRALGLLRERNLGAHHEPGRRALPDKARKAKVPEITGRHG